jgi:hypothetical protein
MRWRVATTLKARMSQTSIEWMVLRLERLWELPLAAVPDQARDRRGNAAVAAAVAVVDAGVVQVGRDRGIADLGN